MLFIGELLAQPEQERVPKGQGGGVGLNLEAHAIASAATNVLPDDERGMLLEKVDEAPVEAMPQRRRCPSQYPHFIRKRIVVGVLRNPPGVNTPPNIDAVSKLDFVHFILLLSKCTLNNTCVR